MMKPPPTSVHSLHCQGGGNKFISSSWKSSTVRRRVCPKEAKSDMWEAAAASLPRSSRSVWRQCAQKPLPPDVSRPTVLNSRTVRIHSPQLQHPDGKIFAPWRGWQGLAGTHCTLRLNDFTAVAAGSLTASTCTEEQVRREYGPSSGSLCPTALFSRTHQEDDAADNHQRPNHRANPYC